MENNLGCLKAIERNLKTLAAASYRLVKSGCLEYLDNTRNKGQSFDLIFLDPPYRQGLAKKCLIKVSACDILNPSGILIAEHHKLDELPGEEGSLMLLKRKSYGQTRLSFYKNIP